MSKYFLATAGAFVFLMFFGTWYTVNQGEEAVVLTNGTISSIKGSGLYFKAPLFQSVEKFSIRTERSTYENVETYSKDIQTAHVKITVNHRLDPAKVGEIYQALGTDYETKLIDNTALSTIKVVFGQYSATESIDHRAALVKDMTDALTKKLSPYGIFIDNVSVENISFSDSYDKAVEARMKAEVEVQQANQTLQQEKIQADIARTQAQGAADSALIQATATAKATKLNGDADAYAIEAKAEALRKNPDVVGLTVAQGWDGKLPTVMVPGGSTPMLALDRLMNQKN